MSQIQSSNVDEAKRRIQSHFLDLASKGALVVGCELRSALLASKFIPVEISKQEVEQALAELGKLGYLKIGNCMAGAMYPESKITSEGVNWIEQSL